MVELSTGYLDFEQLDAEVTAISEDLLAAGISTVYITFGFGCRPEKLVQAEEVPIPATGLTRFVADCETEGTFELGEADLHVRGGGVEFLLCHERDVHCSGGDSPLLASVRRRWTRDYEHSSERRSGGRWRRLAGRPRQARNS